MRLTPDLLSKSEVSLTPTHEVELSLRGEKEWEEGRREEEGMEKEKTEKERSSTVVWWDGKLRNEDFSTNKSCRE